LAFVFFTEKGYRTMRILLLGIAASLIALGLTTTIQAQSVEDQIKARQSAYTFLGWNMNRIRAQVIDEEQPFNPDQVKAAARAIAAVANSGLSAMYGPDTVEGTGWKPTRLKPEFFEELDRVGEIAARFIAETGKLAEVAETGDQAAIARQFRETADSCGACHRNYRASE
jgi:cytochrome c556